MKAVILAGGEGTRLSEETLVKPKPMVEIGGHPILWHIMKIYSSFGINDFVICLGYKGYIIKEYFSNYLLHSSDVTISMKDNKIEVHEKHIEPWTVTLVDTGAKSMTGGRIKRVQKYLNNESFCLTYGDGVADVDVRKSIEFHKKQKTFATVTGVQNPGRFGAIEIAGDRVKSFQEKPKNDGTWINGGFFILEPEIFNYIEGDHSIWEREPMEKLSSENQLSIYTHKGYWQCMDTVRDKNRLNEEWASNTAPWKTWK